MNYEALDEALDFINMTNDDEIVKEDAVLWGLAGVYALLAAFIAIFVSVCSKKYKKRAQPVMDAIKDPEVQKALKKLVDGVQKNILKDPTFKKYAKFVKALPYKYEITNKVGNEDCKEVCVKFPFLEFDMEAIFKEVYGTSMEDYTYEYCLDQPDNGKPAPKFKKYVKGMLKDGESFVSKAFKKSKKCKAIMYVDEYSEDTLDECLELYYDTWLPGNGGEKFTTSLSLCFNKDDFVAKNIEE